MADALALKAEEGRGILREVTGSCMQVLIRKFPNGETQHFMCYFELNT